MKFSHSFISSYLLVLHCNTNTNAFVVQNRPRNIVTSNKNFNNNLHSSWTTQRASTLDGTSTTESIKEDDEASIAVSANHVVVWDDEQNEIRIKECSETLDGRDGNYKKAIIYVEDEHFTQPSTSSSSSSSSSSSTTSPTSPMPSLSSINGIKMVTNTNNESFQKPNAIIQPSISSQEEKVSMEDTVNQIKSSTSSSSSSTSLSERITNSGVASAAAMATAAVNAAVSMKSLEAPSTTKSYISLDTSTNVIDEDGLPLRYDKDAIETYWKKERGALNKRWGYFVGKAVPFLTRLTTLFIKDGKIDEQYIPELSQQARIDLQDLGPTFIKAGQMMSVRPDVLPQVCRSMIHSVITFMILCCSKF